MDSSKQVFLLTAWSCLLVVSMICAQTIEPDNAYQGDSLRVTIRDDWSDFAGGNSPIDIRFVTGGARFRGATLQGDSILIAFAYVFPKTTPGKYDVRIQTRRNGSPVVKTLRKAFEVHIDARIGSVSKITPYHLSQGAESQIVTIECKETNWSYDGFGPIGNYVEARVEGPGVTVKSVRVDGPTTVHLVLDVTRNALTTNRSITLLQYLDSAVIDSVQSPSRLFKIVRGRVGLLPIQPDKGKRGAEFQVTITGLSTHWIMPRGPYGNFSALKLRFSGTGIASSGERILNDTSATATIRIASDAAKGERQVTLIHNKPWPYLSDKTTFPNSFTVGDVGINSHKSHQSATELGFEPAFRNRPGAKSVIQFSLPGATNVAISLFNVMGKEVVAFHRELPAGRHEWAMGSRNLPSGHYILRMQAGNSTALKRVTIAR